VYGPSAACRYGSVCKDVGICPYTEPAVSNPAGALPKPRVSVRRHGWLRLGFHGQRQRFLPQADALRVFDPHEGVEMFDEFASAIKADPEAGRRQALDVIRKEVAHEPEKARLLGRICLAVSGRDGEIPGVELREVASLCQELGLDPLSCGLGEIGNPGTAPRED